ncbi:MAG: acyl-CoA dehydrogenase family protein [Chloroflexi bacterium]|nr:acyl-CoA dehydrogenase family protein [Chloroflexota bacterium]
MDFRYTDAELALRDKVRKLAQGTLAPLAHEADESDELTPAVTQALAKAGLFKYMVPKEYGGEGIKVTNVCLIREELCKVSSKADATFAMQGLGSYPITLAGSEAQKKHYLTKVAAGDAIAAFAITEPEAGSDIANMKLAASHSGDGYVLNGIKKYISNAGFASFYCTFAKTDPKAGGRGVSAFVIDRGSPGLDDSTKVPVLAPHVLGEVKYNNCRIPASALLGAEGQGIKIALSTLDVFRTTVSAAVLGMAEAAYAAAVRYVKQRPAFGQTLADFQSTQFKLAEMATSIEAARYLTYYCAWLKDSGKEQVITEASMAKLFATEMAQKVVDEALQLHGAAGLVRGSLTEKLYREVRQPRVYEGSTEVLKVTIARQLLKDAE